MTRSVLLHGVVTLLPKGTAGSSAPAFCERFDGDIEMPGASFPSLSLPEHAIELGPHLKNKLSKNATPAFR